MNFNNCKNRIKPTLLRDVKTEALLVFIRTTLEQFFYDIEKNGTLFQIGSVEDNLILETTLRELLTNLQDCVVNSTYIRGIIASSGASQAMSLIAKKEEPLMVYYDAIVKQIEISLSQGQNWIPEQLVICLLSEWILEEEKSTVLYPFLSKVNYSELLTRYDNARILAKKDEDWNKTAAIMSMYKVATQLIYKLKNTTYKVNSKRVSKKRRKRKK